MNAPRPGIDETGRPRRSRAVLFAALTGLLTALCLAQALSGPIGRHTIALPGLGTLPAGQFLAVWAATWLLSLCLTLAFPRGLRFGAGLTLLCAAALICRLALLPQAPSDDVYRYLWEGRLVAEGINPYHHAPLDPALAPLAADDPYHAAINHPDMPAAYPPLALMLFALTATAWYSPWAIKALIVVFDLGILCFLAALLRRRGLSPQWGALYAFNPVILYGFAGQAHFDSIQGFFLLGALFWYDRRRWGWMFLFAGLAVQSKYMALLALPLLLRRDNLVYLPVALMAMLLPYLPFLAGGPAAPFLSIVTFGREFAFNGSVHGVLRAMFGRMEPATRLCAALLAAASVFGWWRYHPFHAGRFQDDPVPGCFFVLGAALVLAPTVHPWYLAWIVPFVVLRPTASWLVLTLTAGCWFITVGIAYTTGEWRLPLTARLAIWAPFWILLLREARLAWRRRRTPAPRRAMRSVSVIIPARDEETQIGACVQSARGDPAVAEIIVVDGNSTDRTAQAAARAGARVLPHAAPAAMGGGRGGQCAAGLKSARGDVVAIVHADAHIDGPVFSRILRVLNRDRTVIGGAVGTIFDGRGAPLRVLEFANDLKAAFGGIAFGDQIQFFRREPVVRADAYPALPLMEDVELALRLREMGRTVYLFGSARISPRAWQHGRPARAWLVLRLVALYLWQRSRGRTDTVRMYEQYYARTTRPTAS